MLTGSLQRPGRAVYGPLPRPGTKRWVIRRKAEVVAAVRGGLLSLEQACSRYALSAEEYMSWQESIDRYGLAALRVTRLKIYRRRYEPTGKHLRARSIVV
jgi:Protein of unknown function (DUF1153)